MNKQTKFFVITAFLQLLFLIYPAYLWYDIYNNGTEYKFPIKFYQNIDAVMGNYLHLDFSDSTFLTANNFVPQQTIYASLSLTEQGFAKIATISSAPPTTAVYFQAQANYQTNNMLHLDIPFNKYYLNESLSKQLSATQIEPNSTNAYALVSIKAGRGIVKNIYLNNKPLNGNF